MKRITLMALFMGAFGLSLNGWTATQEADLGKSEQTQKDSDASIERNWELSASSTDGVIDIDEDFFSANAGLGAHYKMNDYLQFGAESNLSYFDSDFAGAKGYGVSLLVGPTLNYSLNGKLEDAFFLRTLGGINYNRSESDFGTLNNTAWEYNVSAGKRFALAENISYSPAVEYNRVEDFDEGDLRIKFVSFSFFF